MAESNIKAVIPGDIHKVWEIVLDIEHYSAWRSALSRTEIKNEKQFVEYTKEGYPTTFSVTAVEPCRRWEFDMENSNMKGHWSGIFTSKGTETEIDFTECVTAKKVYMKPFVKGFLKKQQAQFVADLRKESAKYTGRKFSIFKHVGNISKRNNGYTKELNMIFWDGREPVYDIRTWNDDHTKYGKGVTITPGEMKKLQELIKDINIF